MILLPVALFIFLMSWFLVRDASIDKLVPSLWKAFILTTPLALYVSFSQTLFAFLLLLTCPLIWHFFPRPFSMAHAVLQDFFILPPFFVFFRKKCWRQVPLKYVGAQEKVPILLIHGFRHDKGAWIFHGPRWAKAGLGPIYPLDLGCSNQSVEQYALLVKTKLKEIATDTGHSGIVMLGYSLGGIIAAFYAENLAPPETVKAVITLGSPLEGTYLAQLGHEPCAKQIRFRTPFIQNLRAKIIASSLPYSHVGSLTDTAILPQSSAFIHYPFSRNIEIHSQGHLALLYSSEVNQLISNLLQEFSVLK